MDIELFHLTIYTANVNEMSGCMMHDVSVCVCDAYRTFESKPISSVFLSYNGSIRHLSEFRFVIWQIEFIYNEFLLSIHHHDQPNRKSTYSIKLMQSNLSDPKWKGHAKTNSNKWWKSKRHFKLIVMKIFDCVEIPNFTVQLEFD